MRFPPVFEGFMRMMSRFKNLSFLHVARVDYMIPINFYTTLASMTVALLIGGGLIALVGLFFFKRAATDQGKRKEVLDDTTSVLLTLSYLVFASVSTIIFETFKCRKFGDDPTRYLGSDQVSGERSDEVENDRVGSEICTGSPRCNNSHHLSRLILRFASLVAVCILRHT